jgi:hypothetical protein
MVTQKKWHRFNHVSFVFDPERQVCHLLIMLVFYRVEVADSIKDISFFAKDFIV